MSNTQDTVPATEPHVGMDATYNCGSDRYSGKIVEVTRKGQVIVFERARSGLRMTFSRRRNGRYLEQRDGNARFSLTLGVAEDYWDPHL